MTWRSLIMWLWILTVSCGLELVICLHSNLSPHKRDLLDKMLERDMSSPPFQYTGNTTYVSVMMFLSRIRVLGNAENKAEYDMYTYQAWTDPRLAFNASHDRDFHVVRQKYWSNLWLGETYMEGMAASRLPDPTMPNKFVWLFPNGTLAVGTRISVTIECSVGSVQFPIAVFKCQLKYRVHSYFRNDVMLYWFKNKPIRIAADFTSEDLTLVDTMYQECTDTGSEVVDSACLQIIMKIRKDYTHSIMRVYVPSMFIVFVGWLSFWIDRGEVSARVKLGTLCVLAMITDQVGQNFTSNYPVSVTSIEVWYIVCLFFVSAVLVEFTFVHAIDTYKERIETIAKKRKDRQRLEKLKKKTNLGVQNGGIDSKNSESSDSVESKGSLEIFLEELAVEEEELEIDFPCMCLLMASISAGKIEKWARIIYISAFLLFQVIYWSIFLNAVQIM